MRGIVLKGSSVDGRTIMVSNRSPPFYIRRTYLFVLVTLVKVLGDYYCGPGPVRGTMGSTRTVTVPFVSLPRQTETFEERMCCTSKVTSSKYRTGHSVMTKVFGGKIH